MKNIETIRDMTDKGFAVWAMDWHGQGGSERYLKDNLQKMHGEGYDEHIKTLDQFAAKIVSQSPGPFILTAHSMGAHIGLRYLKEHAGVFDAALLTAPMLDINTGALPKPVARQMARFAKAGSYLEKYVPLGEDWAETREVFANNKKTSDPERFAVTAEIFNAKPGLQMGDATYGWVYHTFESIDILHKEDYLKSITTPILMQISGDDEIVDAKAARRAVGFLPHCTAVDMPAAKHEIWMERDVLRDEWMKHIDFFLARQIKAAPAPKNLKSGNNPPPPFAGPAA